MVNTIGGAIISDHFYQPMCLQGTAKTAEDKIYACKISRNGSLRPEGNSVDPDKVIHDKSPYQDPHYLYMQLQNTFNGLNCHGPLALIS